ncbi:MAG: A24 family peptidase [Woeseiaceae bacterium]|nr:A24 family peptidase [Woeseiaceae bacterium]
MQIPEITWLILVVLGLASFFDLREHRIPNLVTLPTIAFGLVFHVVSGGYDGLLFALAGFAVGLLCFLPLYISRGMGAGDVKLMAAAGTLLGPGLALGAVCLTLAIGAVLAVCVVVKRAVFSRIHLGRHIESGERFPYAVAIAAGVAIALWQKPLFLTIFDLGY